VSKATGQDCAGIPQIAAGLQGGLMTGEVCGAVSGAVLAIGLLHGKDQEETVTQLTGQFMDRFTKLNGSVRCIDIIGFNIGTLDTKLEVSRPMTFLKFVISGGKGTCNKVVSKAVRAACEVINDQS
jgi:C_GCAxxG_C_C family probable redox protein